MLPEQEVAVCFEDELDEVCLDFVVVVDAFIDLVLVRPDLCRDSFQHKRLFFCQEDEGRIYRDAQFCDPLDRRLALVVRREVCTPVVLGRPEVSGEGAQKGELLAL